MGEPDLIKIAHGVKDQAQALKQHTLTAYYAARDPRTAWYVRLLAVCVAGYALSPIDLIPDFIPIIGLLDDLVLIPIGLALILRLIPVDVRAAAELRAAEQSMRPVSYLAAATVLIIWMVVLAIFFLWLRRF